MGESSLTPGFWVSSLLKFDDVVTSRGNRNFHLRLFVKGRASKTGKSGWNLACTARFQPVLPESGCIVLDSSKIGWNFAGRRQNLSSAAGF
jgi:hypothetical protein